MKFLSTKDIKLGDFNARQFTLFEYKPWFSIIFFWFSGDGWQDRYHTHAFDAVSLCLYGKYEERELLNPTTGAYRERPRRFGFRFFPKNSYHSLGESKGCLTLLLSGPWKGNWKEWKNGKEYSLSDGRVRVENVD